VSVAPLEEILPARASVVVARGEVADATLFPEEAAATRRAVENRRREFATGRACARSALAALGLPPRAIPVGPKGEPLWPPGIVGSITHCVGYRACAAARRSDVAAIGIDAEPNRPLRERVLGAVAREGEIALVRRLIDDDPSVRWDRLVFSAKEAAYKAWFPLTGRRLGFEGAEVSIDPCAGTFSVELPGCERRSGEDEEPLGLEGRWTIDEGLILTAAVVAPGSLSRDR
jgi:4'-phosphopantetheinyl transferase EntD